MIQERPKSTFTGPAQETTAPPDAIGPAEGLVPTKLYAPRPGHRLVDRARLRERFWEWSEKRLIVVEAPAGFGKTTLLTQWREAALGDGMAVAWLSIDGEDMEPLRLLRHADAAIRALGAGTGASARLLLIEGEQVSADAVVKCLADDIARSPRQIGLILDDFHLAGPDEVARAVDRLIAIAPPNFHLALATRSTPTLSLGRLRAHGQLAEIGTTDLRVSVEEADKFLNGERPLDLDRRQVSSLVDRTEGWIAGLQLALLSLRDRPDKDGFINSFSGGHRAITDYLGDDVIDRLPHEVQRFLLETSILDRFNHAVCDAVTGRVNGHTVLRWIERENLFLIPLDDRREWYRFHHLFADVLRQRLSREKPDQIAGLHLRAATWFKDAGMIESAIAHYFSAGDVNGAAQLAESVAYRKLFDGRDDESVRRWLRRFGEGDFSKRPILAICDAWRLTRASQFWEAEERLVQAETALEDVTTDPLEEGATDQIMSQLLQIRGAIQILHFADLDQAETNSRRALELAPADDQVSRTIAYFAYGLSRLFAGHPKDAIEGFAHGTRELSRGEGLLHAGGLMLYFQMLAHLYAGQGREGERHLAGALSDWNARNRPPVPMMGLAETGLGQARLQKLDFDAAETLIRTGNALVDIGYDRLGTIFAHLAAADLHCARGKFDAAIHEAELVLQIASDNDMPHLARLARARLARTWLQSGQEAKALMWARNHDVLVPENPDIVQEAEGLTLAQLWQVRGEVRRSRALLRRLGAAARQNGRVASQIEIGILEALCVVSEGEAANAVHMIRQILDDAVAAETFLPFHLGGKVVRDLVLQLRRANRTSEHPTAPDAISRLYDAWAAMTPREAGPDGPASTGGPNPAPKAAATSLSTALMEPLSKRERAVLALLVEGFTNQEIAERLFVARSTIKKHVNHIYAKLDVRTRPRAIIRAREVGLV